MSVYNTFAATYSYNDSWFSLQYSDYPESYKAKSNAAVISGTRIQACVGVRDAGGECGALVTDGKQSSITLTFASSSYNNHVHFIRDENDVKSFIE